MDTVDIILQIKNTSNETLWSGSMSECPYGKDEYKIYAKEFPSPYTVLYIARISPMYEIEW